ncbi:MAG: glucosyl transferase, partial [Ignavibacteriae bacterium HGW-Ignavibacteriae-3]
MISFNLLKRIVDLILSLVLIILTFPVQIVIALAILIIIKENPIFSQTRALTLAKYPFTMFKFRTIKTTQFEKQSHNESEKRFLIPNRGIKFGRFTEWIRRSGLDELPQLYNVLLGHMSLIGPRPLMVYDLNILKSQFPVQNDLRGKISSKPGITGIWQIYGNRALGAENLIALDLLYEESKS